jgi:hypothetical protein
MRKLLLIPIAVVVCAVSFAQTPVPVDPKPRYLKTLTILTETLYSLQQKDSLQEEFGGIRCPETKIYYSRAAESVFPFAMMYQQTGDKKYLRAAINVGNWLIGKQEKEGQWIENPWAWTGTTADQLLMMVCSYRLIKNELGEHHDAWVKSMQAAADYLTAKMSPDFASINYCPTTAAVLAAIYVYAVKDEKYLNKARLLSRQVLAKMDEDGFIEGEAARVFKAKYGVDWGYQIDMSLWGLGLYAKLTRDDLVEKRVRQSLANVLYFVYPNGIIDGSWGARAYKWTSYGSKTADGCQVLFSLYAKENPQYLTASLRNLEYLVTNIQQGMVGYGPHYWKMPNENAPNLYPTFARAKNLALALLFGYNEPQVLKPLPADGRNWWQYFPTVNVGVIKTSQLMATVSGYGYTDIENWGKGKYTHIPGGGAICNLYAKGYGLVQTSSQTKYIRGEEVHMPAIKDTLYALTPRIEYHDANGFFTNLYETRARISNKGTAITVHGELCDEKRRPGGVSYRYQYLFQPGSLTKKVYLRYHDESPVVSIIEPFVQHPGTIVKKINNKTLEFTHEKTTIRFSLVSGTVNLSFGEQESHYWFPFPAIKCYPVKMELVKTAAEYEQEVVFRIELVQ